MLCCMQLLPLRACWRRWATYRWVWWLLSVSYLDSRNGPCACASGRSTTRKSSSPLCRALIKTVCALPAVQFLTNMLFARFINKEHISKRVMLAMGLVVSGAVLMVAFGNHESPILTAHDLMDLYSKQVVCCVSCICAAADCAYPAVRAACCALCRHAGPP